ncbi:hypothetical protein BFJ66_g1532 [Fusarium oxysporum f. sp. cepae]|uniref:Uncharacterized protein n=1 Tax=Fusarium oxysporum f. sp. cepae TaxID=396571 RepID=A0A3L6P4T4_FUSOX|nr:hypothetical protein BFJ65_g275 [Fusarium oxysporum f. sp. cepae]RKK60927.1 hypothetical protein BFJ66_g1532 [Fusarium oxysporum f. sp. cepae]
MYIAIGHLPGSAINAIQATRTKLNALHHFSCTPSCALTLSCQQLNLNVFQRIPSSLLLNGPQSVSILNTGVSLLTSAITGQLDFNHSGIATLRCATRG